MKPHPRIRKTIKWGGAAVTVLLVVVWVASAAHWVSYLGTNGRGFVVGRGTVAVYRKRTSQVPAVLSGWQHNRVSDISGFWDDARMRLFYPIAVPIWPLILATAVPTALAFRLDSLATRRARIGLCPKCGYSLAGLAADVVCPECGSAPSALSSIKETATDDPDATR